MTKPTDIATLAARLERTEAILLTLIRWLRDGGVLTENDIQNLLAEARNTKF